MPTTPHTDEGASPKELLFEAARRDNHSLLTEVLLTHHTADFLNTSTDALGNTALHVAAQYGSYDVIDELLEQEGLEVDPVNTLERDTPLHKAVYFAKEDKVLGLEIVKMLVEAGADPRIRNKHKQKPIDISDPRDTELREVLQKGEYMMSAGDDVVVEDETGDVSGSGSEEDESD